MQTILAGPPTTSEHEGRYRTLIERTPDACYVLRSDRFVYLNPAAVAMFGALSAEELLGTHILERVHPECRSFAEARVRRIVEGGLVAPLTETRLLRMDGSVFDAEIEGTPIVFDGAPAVHAAVRDISARRRSEEQLVRSEERHRFLLSTAMDGFWLTDLQGRLLAVNDAYCRMSGYSEAELLTLGISDIEAAESPADIAAHIQRLFELGQDRFESRHRHKDGSVFDVEVGSSYSPVDGGRVFVFLRDITASKRAEAALRASEERYRRIFAESPIGVALIDSRTGRFCKANPAYAAIVGRSVADLESITWMDITHPDDVRADAARMEQLNTGEISEYSLIKRYLHSDGVNRTIRLTVAAMSATEDGQHRHLAMVEDITAHRSADALVRLQGTALAAAADAIVITDACGVIDWVNAAFATATGCRPDAVVGLPLDAVLEFGPEPQPSLAVACAMVAAEGQWRGEVVSRRGDGAAVTLQMALSALRNDAKEITHFIAVGQDVTDRRMLEEAFRQSQKMESIGRLAGGVAHDFNNMLTVILGHTELAILGMDPQQPLYSRLADIHAAASRSARLTRQLLAFARKQKILPRVINLNEAVSDALRLLERLIGENIQLRWVPQSGLWTTLLDPSQLDQVLANLCVNAKDAIGESGAVTIETANCTLSAEFCAEHDGAEPGDYVRLTVRDDGAGMSAEVRAHIFEPFFTTKGPGEGTGLGLATVYGGIRQSRGFIDVASQPGVGSTFDVYLPRHDGRTEPSVEGAAPASKGRRNETILVVEDEAAILTLVAASLEREGYTVLMAAGPVDAVRIVAERARPIDLLLTDVVMPGMTGPELARTLLELDPQLTCLFMSGYAMDQLPAGVASDESHFISKPFTLVALSSRVREVIDASRVG